MAGSRVLKVKTSGEVWRVRNVTLAAVSWSQTMQLFKDHLYALRSQQGLTLQYFMIYDGDYSKAVMQM